MEVEFLVIARADFDAAGMATIDCDLKRGGSSAFLHVDAIIKLSPHREQNEPCSSRPTDGELQAAIVGRGVRR